MNDVLIYRFDQFRYAGENPAAQSLGRDVPEKSFDHVQPRCRGWREVHGEAGMLGKPLLHSGVFVRGVVIGNQMQRFILGRLSVDGTQEFQPLRVTMPLLALRDDLTVQHVQSGEQCGRTVALVVVRHGGRTPLLQWQPGLRAIERLHLALLVAAQHQGVLGRRHVQRHDVFELLHKLRITRDLEPAQEMGFETIGTPVARNAGGAHAQFLSHRTRAPVSGCLGCTSRGQRHQARHIHLHWWRAAWQVAFDTRQARLQVALAPTRDLDPPDVQLPRNVHVLHAIGGEQDDAGALRQPDTGEFGARESRQLGMLIVAQHNFGGRSHVHSPPSSLLDDQARENEISSIKSETLH